MDIIPSLTAGIAEHRGRSHPGSWSGGRRPGTPGKRLNRAPVAFREVQRLFEAGVRHHVAGQIDRAVAEYKAALALKPDFADAYNNLGVALLAQGSTEDAVAHYECALILNPDHFNARSNLGNARLAQGRIGEAIVHYERSLAITPGHAAAHCNLANALAAQGRTEEAVARYRHALLLSPDYADANNNLGNLLSAQGNIDEAALHYRRALAVNPDDASAHNNLANILRDQGKFSEALIHYDRALAVAPANAVAHYNRAEIKVFRPGDADLAALEALADRRDLPAAATPFVHFALAKALEDTGEYARSFEHLRHGNFLKRRQIHYDEPRMEELIRRISTVFDRGLFERLKGAGDPSPVPIFVLGMPRSGSTLIEQILASHPRIHGAGELTDLEKATRAAIHDVANAFPECMSALDRDALRRIGRAYLDRLPTLADGKDRIVNKLPDNFLRVGLIRLVLPNARIIHTMRNPVDTCVSCFSKLFASGQHFSYHMEELGRYYRRYTELMNHWQSVLPADAMLHVSYEDVVDDIEGQARRLIDYCGLPWDDRCIGFHTNSRPVRTASAVQVRKPLFRSSLQRWRRYEAGIAPLLRELGDVVPGVDAAYAVGVTAS